MARATFSIVVPTFARPGRVRACLSAVAQLRYPRECFDVTIVDDGSPAPPDAEVAEFADRLNVRLLRQANAGPGAARNAGAAAATGRYLAFTADDCTPAPDWLDRLAHAFAVHGDRMIGGRIEHALPHDLCATASHLLIDYLYGYYNRDAHDARFFTPNNMAMPAEQFHAVGGFDATTGATGEDRELCRRWLDRGWRMTYCEAAVVGHAHPLTLRSFLKQQYAYGVGSQKYRKRLARRRAAGGADGAARRGTPEPLSFYKNLVLHPLNHGRGPRAWGLVSLLVASQVANALGVAVEKFRHDPAGASGADGVSLPVTSPAQRSAWEGRARA